MQYGSFRKLTGARDFGRPNIAAPIWIHKILALEVFNQSSVTEYQSISDTL